MDENGIRIRDTVQSNRIPLTPFFPHNTQSPVLNTNPSTQQREVVYSDEPLPLKLALHPLIDPRPLENGRPDARVRETPEMTR